MNDKYLEIDAGVRYFEDATLNGLEDTKGLISCKAEDRWKPIIELNTGKILNWKIGDTANIHYKVCDDGEYWLLDENKNKTKKWKGYYVPDDLLANGNGYGDYIILNINKDGIIENFNYIIDEDDWETI